MFLWRVREVVGRKTTSVMGDRMLKMLRRSVTVRFVSIEPPVTSNAAHILASVGGERALNSDLDPAAADLNFTTIDHSITLA